MKLSDMEPVRVLSGLLKDIKAARKAMASADYLSLSMLGAPSISINLKRDVELANEVGFALQRQEAAIRQEIEAFGVEIGED